MWLPEKFKFHVWFTFVASIIFRLDQCCPRGILNLKERKKRERERGGRERRRKGRRKKGKKEKEKERMKD